MESMVDFGKMVPKMHKKKDFAILLDIACAHV